MSKKKIITIVSVLAVILLSVSVISYSIANRGNGGNNKISDNLAQRGAGTIESTYVTNIDLIIENSKKSPIENYNIVEIIPNSASPSSLGDYISDELFKDYVIDENSTSDPKAVMASDAIKLDVIKVSAGTTMEDTMNSNILGGESTIREILDETDLIYLSTPSYSAYDGNMSEDIYNYLHTYTLGKNKPMIMDYVTQGSSGSTEKSSYTYKELVKTISNNHIRFKTFAWQSEADAKDFFGRDTSKGSYYITYNTNNNDVNANVLVIANSGKSSGSMYSKMEEMEPSDLISLAYYGNHKPTDELEYEVIAPNALTSEKLDVEYDFILIENDVASDSMSKEVYTKLRSLSESGRYILYDGRLADSSGDTTTTIPATNNYLKLMELLLTNTGLPRYAYILPVTYGFFDSLIAAGESGIAGAKTIADIINAGDYRGSGSNGSNGKMFRVLELQPCYPIDLDLAKKGKKMTYNIAADRAGLEGNYYEAPSLLVSGVTKDEIEEGTQYYDFDLSRAKIAKATGLAYNQIQVDQMSTNEFISKKDVVLETYDLVYIGGNTSALTPHTYIEFLGLTVTHDNMKILLPYLSTFDMYTHTGIFAPLQIHTDNVFDVMREVVTEKRQSLDYATGAIFMDGTAVSTMTEFNGNDITSIKYKELAEYVEKGMPIIVEKKAADAFEKSKSYEKNRLQQLGLRDIDPDSWMYKTLDKIYAASKSGAANVEWGLDADANEIVDSDGNAERRYGNTLGSALTLFNEQTNDKIRKVMSSGAIHPNLTVVSSPKEYSEGNKNSYNKYKDGFVVEAYASPATDDGGKKFDISLYIDLDGNGVFSEGSINADGECADTKSYTYKEPGDTGETPDTVSLKYNMDEDFYGIISWKVVAKDVDTGLVSSVSGYAYYEREEEATKKEIEILQILPRTSGTKKKMNDAMAANEHMDVYNTGITLYLCTECQICKLRPEYNPYSIASAGTSQQEFLHNLGQNMSGTAHSFNGVEMGLHEHKFGIVKFDSATQEEDWESNLADVLIGKDGDYNVDVDVMYSDEFEDLVAQIQAQTPEQIEANKLLMEKAYADIETYELDPNYIAAEKAVKEKLISMQGNSDTMSQYFKQFAEDGEYYKYWMYNIVKGVNSADATEYRALYNKYIEYKDKIVQAKRDYRKYRRLAYRTDQWMANNYSLVVLGWAEDFGGADLNDKACAMLTDYINRGGSMLNTHDSTTKYAKAGAINITEKLRDAFGMDRFHIVGPTKESSGSGVAGASNVLAELTVPEYAYTKPVQEETDAKYTVQFIGPVGSNTHDLCTFEVPKGTFKDVNIKLQLVNYVGKYEGTWQNIASNTHTDSSKQEGPTTVTVTAQWGRYNDSNLQNVPDGTHIVVLDENVRDASYNRVQVATGEIKDGSVTITIPSHIETTKKSKTTKEFKDSVAIMLKNADRDFDVSLVDSEGWQTASIAEGTTGPEKTDISENLKVTIHLQFPGGMTDELKELLKNSTGTTGLSCRLNHDGRDYYASADENGDVTFEVPQVSNLGGNNISADALQYRRFETDGAEYFLTERDISEDYVKWNEFMVTNNLSYGNIRQGWIRLGYNSPVGVTDTYIMCTTSATSGPYRYVEYDAGRSTLYDFQYEASSSVYGPGGASQVNKGIVTTYPFLISSELRIAQTHSQTYALDMEDEDVSVWYTLSSGTGRNDPNNLDHKKAASYTAASPHDGMNNYYLYSKGNIFYCGSGHSPVTGPKKDNNDERRLFINVIVNSVRNAGGIPKITVHRKDTNGAEVKEDKNEKLNVDDNGKYYYNVDDNDEIPEFDFRVKVDSKADLAEVYVFYDLDYGLDDPITGKANYSNAYEADTDHVLIAQYNTQAADSGVLVSKQLAKLRKYVEEPESGYKNLQLKPEYFEVYGGNYTYIVIQATDTNGKTAYQRIKINLVPKLWELTMTEPANSRILLDVSDRVKYNI